MKKCILIVAHGSPVSTANQEFYELCDKLQTKLPGFLIRATYLGSSLPSLTEALEQLITEGARTINVLPYFLLAGKHTTSDIPEIIEHYKKKYPQIKLTLSPHLGDSPKIMDFLLDILSI